jgi:CRISPR system Cascade subunit CasB
MEKGEPMEKEGKATTRGQAFVDAILPRLKEDTAFAAALKRADNRATEYQAWEHLVRYGCDIEQPRERAAFTTVAAAAARHGPERDGTLDVAASIARCFEGGNLADPARAKIRRLLACADTEEACRIIRPCLSLVAAKSVPISYGRLLDQLLYFNERVRLSWAQSFYRSGGEER